MRPEGLKCECGSRLRCARRCGLDLTRVTAPDGLRHLAPAAAKAVKVRAAGDAATAERLCFEILDLAPDYTPLLLLLPELCQTRGHRRAALVLLHRAVASEPNDFGATNELTLMLIGGWPVGRRRASRS